MIVMINGAFGVGKTTIAAELHKEVENSMIYDPEEIGYMLRHILPDAIKRKESLSGDFQDLHLWRELTVTVAKSILTQYKVNLIVPMTIREPEYFRYIREGFRNLDSQTYHFCLTASKETIYDRLRERGEEEGNWCFKQTDLCLAAYEKYNFGEYIDTNHASIPSIVETIKEKLQLNLQ